MKKVLYFMFIAILGLTKVSYGDGLTDSHTVSITIPSLALVDIETATSTTSISISLAVPTEAGDGLSDGTNSDLWLNYSSIKTPSIPTRTVTVNLGTATTGFDLKVAAAAAASGYVGTIGSPTSELNLTTSSQTLISGIGSCYTVSGPSKGHHLTYTVTPQLGSNYGNIEAQTATPITVTYTISN